MNSFSSKTRKSLINTKINRQPLSEKIHSTSQAQNNYNINTKSDKNNNNNNNNINKNLGSSSIYRSNSFAKPSIDVNNIKQNNLSLAPCQTTFSNENPHLSLNMPINSRNHNDLIANENQIETERRDETIIESIKKSANMSLIPEPGRTRFVNCNVTLYNNGKFDCQLKRTDKVKNLFKLVTAYLKIWEVDYFALRLFCKELNQIIWLDLNDPICNYAQKDSYDNFEVKCYFTLKFYLIDPGLIEDDNTRYFYFSQIYSDISRQKIVVPKEIQPELYGLVLQSQVGDFNVAFSDNDDKSLNKPSYVLNSTPDIAERACEFHKELIGLQPPQAEARFLDLIKNCYGYSWISFSVYNKNKIPQKLHLASYGIVVTSKGQIVDIHEWSNIQKISTNKKELKLSYFISSQFTSSAIFSFNSSEEANSIFKYAKSYMQFYCKRYLPRRKIVNAQKFSLSRTRSFVIHDSNSKNQSIIGKNFDTSNISNANYHDAFSSFHVSNPNTSFINPSVQMNSSLLSNTSVAVKNFDNTINGNKNNQNSSKNCRNFSVNIDALKRGLMQNADNNRNKKPGNNNNNNSNRKKPISSSTSSVPVKSILKDNSLTEMLDTKNTQDPKKSERRVTILLEKKTSTVSLDSFSFKSET